MPKRQSGFEAQLGRRLLNLTAVQEHFPQELWSLLAVGDFVRFLVWFGIGWFGVWWQLDSNTSKQRCIAVMTASGSVVASSLKNWWLLSVCLGAVTSLLERNLQIHRSWEHCHDLPYLPFSYLLTQRFAEVLGPVVAWWVIWKSQALDRVYETAPLTRSWGQRISNIVFGFGWRHQRHNGSLGCGCGGRRFQSVLCVSVGKKKIKFYRDDGHHTMRLRRHWTYYEESDSSDHGSHESDETASMCTDDWSSESDGDCEGQPGWNARLINSRHGDDVKVRVNIDEQYLYSRPPPQAAELRFVSASKEQEDWVNKLAKHGGAGLLLCHYPNISNYDQHATVLHAGRPCFCCNRNYFWWLWFAFGVLCGIGLILPSKLVGYASIVLQLLPELTDDVLPDGSSLSNPDVYEHMVYNMSSTFNRSWICIAADERNTSDGVVERLAAFDSTWVILGCMCLLVMGCYHLQATSESLRLLNGLLSKQSSLQGELLSTLHRIRSAISNKRFLEFLAPDAFPWDSDDPSPGSDGVVSLLWWMETRAALYEDAAFTLSKRKPIFGLCLLAEMLLITATAFALVRGKQKFAIMCYAALYGVALGTLTLLLIFFGHRVNAQLSAGIDLLKELELVESASPVSPERKEAALDAYRSSVLGVSHPKEVEAFLRHEKLHAVTLTFMGIPFDLGLL
ncbi:unnamed protein product, partial [Effrenium voratum]